MSFKKICRPPCVQRFVSLALRLFFMRHQRNGLDWDNTCHLSTFPFEVDPEEKVPKTVCPSSRFASTTCVVAEKSIVAISNQNHGSTNSTRPFLTSSPARKSSK